MAIIVRRPWTEQPQDPTQADPSLKPSRLWTPPTREVVAGATPTTDRPARQPNRGGLGASFSGSTSERLQFAAPQAGGDMTLVAQFQTNSTANQVITGLFSSGFNVASYIAIEGGTIRTWCTDGSNWTDANGPAVSVGTLYTVVSVFVAGGGRRMFINGAFAASSAVARNPTVLDIWTSGLYTANGATDAALNGALNLAAVIPAALSDGLAAEISANPWQLFRPCRIWVPVAAGSGPATFDASVAGTASTSAALTTAIRLAGSVNGSASVAAPLTTAIRFAGSFNATASTSAALTTAIRAAASVTGTATATGALTTAIRMAGSVSGSATVSANLSAGGGVAASVSASATATAALTTSIRLAAAVSAQATASAALTTAIRLASAVSGSATTTAALTATSGGVAAAVTASASATASLTTAVRMAAIANASASASAALAGSIATTTGSVVYLPIRALTGLWSTSIASESDLTNLRAWLPPQRVALVDSNGVMRAEWYRFFHFLAETKLGGAASATLPEIATSLTSAVAQSSAASLATASLAQQVTSNADALDVVVQVAQNNSLAGAGSIPPVQRSTQQIQ